MNEMLSVQVLLGAILAPDVQVAGNAELRAANRGGTQHQGSASGVGQRNGLSSRSGSDGRRGKDKRST